MNSLVVGMLSALFATNQAVAASNVVAQTAGISVSIPDPNDPVEKEFKKLEADDDAAQAEVDGWIQENAAFAAKGAGVPNAELNRRIMKRFESVRTGYEDFIKRNPKHAKVRVAYASFLNDIHDEEAEKAQLDKALELDPNDPAVWNNLANYHGHRGPVTQAFAYYEKAITLNPKEPVYFQNFATTVYLFRKDATMYYDITEQQVFDKALNLYEKALRLNPTNFPLATDLAQSYYGIKPVRTEDALRAWTNALVVANDEIEREGVYIHLARFKLNAGRFAEAHAHLDAVTNTNYAELKARLRRNLGLREAETKGTNAPAAGNFTNAPSSGAAVP